MIVKSLRYNVLKRIAKILTPSFYNIVLESYIKEVLDPIKSDFHYRPSINKIMKNYSFFQNKKLLGVEIGTNYGSNALNILTVLDIDKLYLVDIWDFFSVQFNSENAYEVVRKTFSKNEKVIIIRDFSINAVKEFRDKSLDFVYIDANHNYENVYQDIKVWSEKVKVNGIVAGHDISDLEVYKAVNDYCKENNLIMKVKTPDWYYWKV